MTKVYLHPDHAETNNGIGQVINAQLRYLPELGIEIVKDPRAADIIACHVAKNGVKQVDVLHCHGLYWTGDPGSGHYSNWHHEANRQIVSAAREALFITVPSSWVGEPFRRDMHIDPVIIGHGIDIGAWGVRTPNIKAPVLWNKNRGGDVCDPRPAFHLAQAGINVISTFSIEGLGIPRTMQVTGTIPHQKMKELIYQSGIYLATTQETFGIGTLEAMAGGLPVIGYRHGATPELVRDGIDGILVEPGDLDGLIDAYKQITPQMGINARKRAEQFTWAAAMKKYADLYKEAAEHRPKFSVSVVITNHPNNTKYVAKAIKSVLDQKEAPDEIIVVDDNTSPESQAVINAALGSKGKVIAKTGIGGAAGSRNSGIEAAIGEFITCLDADDMLKPNFVRMMKAAISTSRDIGVVYANFDFMGPDERVTSVARPGEFEFEKMAQASNPPVALIPTPSACMFRRKVWERCGGYRQRYAPAEDAEFWLRALSLGWTARKVEQNLTSYRVHPGTESRTKQYKPYDRYHSWMNSKRFPMAAPLKSFAEVRSYHKPFVSVIIPVGGYHAKYFYTAVESVEWQSFSDWELILINDTGEALDLSAYPYVKEICTEGATGAGHARNMGLRKARGTMCVFLDADDQLEPEFLAKTIAEYAERGGRYIYTDWIDTEGNTVKSGSYDQHEWKNQHPVTVLMETEVARDLGFDEDMPGWEDWDFFLKCAVNGVMGYRLPEPLLVYNKDSGKRRNDAFQHEKELLAILKERYQAYYTGVKPMPGCCGGGKAAQVILEAKRAMDGNKVSSLSGKQSAVRGAIPMPTKIRMQYVGNRAGSVTFKINGRDYRGGSNLAHRYIDAEPEDVDKLEATGHFAVVVRSPVVPAPARQEIIEPPKKVLAYDNILEENADAVLDFLKANPPEAGIKEALYLSEMSGRARTVVLEALKPAEAIKEDEPELPFEAVQEIEQAAAKVVAKRGRKNVKR